MYSTLTKHHDGNGGLPACLIHPVHLCYQDTLLKILQIQLKYSRLRLSHHSLIHSVTILPFQLSASQL